MSTLRAAARGVRPYSHPERLALPVLVEAVGSPTHSYAAIRRLQTPPFRWKACLMRPQPVRLGRSSLAPNSRRPLRDDPGMVAYPMTLSSTPDSARHAADTAIRATRVIHPRSNCGEDVTTTEHEDDCSRRHQAGRDDVRVIASSANKLGEFFSDGPRHGACSDRVRTTI